MFKIKYFSAIMSVGQLLLCLDNALDKIVHIYWTRMASQNDEE